LNGTVFKRQHILEYFGKNEIVLANNNNNNNNNNNLMDEIEKHLVP
jgi:hypothetical protein